MKKFSMLLALLLPIAVYAQVAVTSLRVNRLDTPVGISPAEPPTLSWIIDSPQKNTMQTAYEIVVRCQDRMEQRPRGFGQLRGSKI